MIVKYAAGLSISQNLFWSHASVEATIHSHDGSHSQILVSHVLLSLPLCYFCLSLHDYQCRLPIRVVSWAAQAATVVQPVHRHGEMLRLIHRRLYCLNIPQ